MKFDIGEKEFIRLAEEKPVIIQLMAPVDTKCTPLDLYASLDKNCAYLLESVEKEKRHAVLRRDLMRMVYPGATRWR